MSIQALYNTQSFQVDLKSSQISDLTKAILDLKEQVNQVLTHTLESEKEVTPKKQKIEEEEEDNLL